MNGHSHTVWNFKGDYAGNVTVKAQWGQYTVTYNANGGSGAPGAQTKTYGQTLTLSGTRPTRSGYTFQGWATSASGAVAYQPGGSYTTNGAVTLYAVWRQDLATKVVTTSNYGEPVEYSSGGVSDWLILCNDGKNVSLISTNPLTKDQIGYSKRRWTYI